MNKIELTLIVVFALVMGLTFVETFKVLSITQSVLYKAVQ